MEKLKCWYNINLDISNAIKSNWEWPSPNDRDWGVWHLPAHKIFNSDWLKSSFLAGIPIKDIMLFYRPSNFFEDSAHVDEPGQIGAINWCIGGQGSEMLWYKIPTSAPITAKNAAGTWGSNWPVTILTNLDRGCITSTPTIVRVDVPHTVVMKDDPRWCISARLNISFTTWEQYVGYFESKNLIIHT